MYIENCTKLLKSDLSYNLKRHIINFHIEIFEENESSKTVISEQNIELKEYTIKHKREFIVANSVRITKDFHFTFLSMNLLKT